MIAVPKQKEGNEHLKILQMLSSKLMDDKFRENYWSHKQKKRRISF
jgi:fructose PTS system EIIBC or EIIC component